MEKLLRSTASRIAASGNKSERRHKEKHHGRLKITAEKEKKEEWKVKHPSKMKGKKQKEEWNGFKQEEKKKKRCNPEEGKCNDIYR